MYGTSNEFSSLLCEKWSSETEFQSVPSPPKVAVPSPGDEGVLPTSARSTPSDEVHRLGPERLNGFCGLCRKIHPTLPKRSGTQTLLSRPNDVPLLSKVLLFECRDEGLRVRRRRSPLILGPVVSLRWGKRLRVSSPTGPSPGGTHDFVSAC